MTPDEGAGGHVDAPLQVFIYGSCVSRDSFSAFSPGRYSLLQYTARQSLISAYHPAAPGYLHETGDASFQHRMLRFDARSTVVPDLVRRRDEIDLLLVDLTDERLGVYPVGGGYVTRSVELISTGLDAVVRREAALVPFGSEDHLALWSESLLRFRDDLRVHGLLERTVVLRVPWAGRTHDGRPAAASFGITAHQGNRLYEEYYDRVLTSGLQVLELDEDEVEADPRNQWGEAPFHYTAPVYAAVAAGVDALVRDRRGA